jgi:hypothetical protein
VFYVSICNEKGESAKITEEELDNWGLLWCEENELFEARLKQGCHADDIRRTDGRTDGRTMAAGASVTWTHCSILFEVT